MNPAETESLPKSSSCSSSPAARGQPAAGELHHRRLAHAALSSKSPVTAHTTIARIMNSVLIRSLLSLAIDLFCQTFLRAKPLSYAPVRLNPLI